MVVGIFILANPATGLASLTLALAVYLLAEALLEFILGLQLRGKKGVGWLWLDGIINLVLRS